MKRLVSVLVLLCFAWCLAAADIKERLETILPRQVVEPLISTGLVQNGAYRENGKKLTLVPENALAKEAVSFWTGNDPSFFTESLYLYKKPAKREKSAGSDAAFISIILRSLSRLEGIQYYSTSRKKMRILYEKSYVVDGEKTRNRISDPVKGSADNVTLYVIQKDLTFGEYLYRYDYRQTSDTVAFYSRNIDTMSLSFLKLLQPEKLRVSLVVQDLGDYLLVYGLTRADFPKIPGIEDKINASFSTRAQAVYNWFIKEYEKQ